MNSSQKNTVCPGLGWIISMLSAAEIAMMLGYESEVKRSMSPLLLILQMCDNYKSSQANCSAAPGTGSGGHHLLMRLIACEP